MEFIKSTGNWSGSQWTPLTSEFVGILDGLGHTITGLYINNSQDNQGLFGTLKGTVKNLSIEDSYVKANSYVGSIAGKNEGTIINCYNTGAIIGNTNVTGGYFKSMTTGELVNVWSDNVLDENTYFVSGTYTATAPKGFKISKNVLEQTIEDGMVIQDEEGNEFVWVPVEVNDTDTETSIASFYRSTWEYDDTGGKRLTTLSTMYVEPYAEGYMGGVDEYYDMLASVYKNEGFYIGRFEAGSTTPRTEYEEDGITRKENGTTQMVVKRDAYPYNYVGWGKNVSDYITPVIDQDGLNQGKGALLLSKELYGTEADVGKYGVTSTLCYGVMWESMLEFIKSKNNNVLACRYWGNYYDNLWTLERITAQYYDSSAKEWKTILEQGKKLKKEASKAILLTTGADDDFSVKNIFDIAGNVAEITMEVYTGYNRAVCRGGNYEKYGNGDHAAIRTIDFPYRCYIYNSFRPVLYINN